MHAVIENQLAENEPPEARGALARLLKEDPDRHEAIHAIADVFIKYYFPNLKAGANAQPFDSEGYREKLRNLTFDSWRRVANHSFKPTAGGVFRSNEPLPRGGG